MILDSNPGPFCQLTITFSLVQGHPAAGLTDKSVPKTRGKII